MHDIHYQEAKRKEFIRKNQVRYIFSIYRDAFLKMFPEFAPRMHWLPHWVNTDLFRDYGLNRNINWLMMGKMASYYPLRQKIYQSMKGKTGFVYHHHPGYRKVADKEKRVFVGERYAREISRAKMFLTCDSSFHYPLIKYYEVLACKTLLLAPASRELHDLGFIPGTNYVSINDTNFFRQANYYLKNVNERRHIAEAGYKMVRTRHSVALRAGQLKKMIDDIIGS